MDYLLEFENLYKSIISNYENYNILSDIKNGIIEDMTKYEINEFISLSCASYIAREPDFNKLACHYSLLNIYNNVNKSSYMNILEEINKTNILSEDYKKYCYENIEFIDSILDFEKDKLFDFFGLRTLIKTYLLKSVDGNIIECPQHLFLREAIQVHLNKINNENIKNTYYYLSNLYYTHATPTLFNSGTNRSQLSSCFLMSCEDSIVGIAKSWENIAHISKYAGGIGISLSDIRGKNSKIKSTNGKSDGIVPLCKVYQSIALYVNQSGKRNGSIAIYLEPWHSDIFSFIDLRRITGDESEKTRDLFLGLWIPDIFMESVKNDTDWYLMSPDVCSGLTTTYGDEFKELYYKYVKEEKYVKKIKAVELYQKILESQIETGMPYMCYKDAANKKSNQKNLGTIKSSNLCVAPETKILTDKGYFEIKTLEDQNVNIWNGKEFSNVKIIKTGENQKLIKVNFSNGESIECTPYHRFVIQKNYNKKPLIVEAKDLKPDMKIFKYNLPIIDNLTEDIKYPYTNGFFSADGTFYDKKEEIKQCEYKIIKNNLCGHHQQFKNIESCCITEMNGKCIAKTKLKRGKIDLYGDKRLLIPFIDKREGSDILEYEKIITVSMPLDISDKYTVPINASIKNKLDWFAGLCDGDGCTSTFEGYTLIQISSIHLEFLKNVRLMLTTLGINPKISVLREESDKMMPDGNGGQKLYPCQKCYRLLLSSGHVNQLNELGFKTHRLDTTTVNPKREVTKYIKITNIEDNNRFDDTYCFNEPKLHQGIFNGILTMNCSEVILHTSKEEIATCNLASISLPKFVNEDRTFNFELLGKVTELATYNLNNVIDVNYYPVKETENSNLKNRPLGLGVQGLVDTYFKMGYSFDSPEAFKLNRKIFECIYYHSVKSSNNMAKTDGTYSTFSGSPFSQGILQFHMWDKTVEDLHMDGYPDFQWNELIEDVKKYGTRNSQLTALMPTASTSQIMGNYECFEPFASNIFVRKMGKHDIVVINNHLVKELKELNLWNDETYNELLYYDGSIKNMNIPENLKTKYKTAFELQQSVLVKQSIERGCFIDQSQSLNIFMENPDFNKLNKAHFFGWQNGGCNSLKTGIYYLRSRAAKSANKFGLDPEVVRKIKEKNDDEVCLQCSA